MLDERHEIVADSLDQSCRPSSKSYMIYAQLDLRKALRPSGAKDRTRMKANQLSLQAQDKPRWPPSLYGQHHCGYWGEDLVVTIA